MAASNSSMGKQQQTVPEKPVAQNQPAESSQLFLTRMKTAAGETSQLCRKVVCMKNDKSTQIQYFQPLTSGEILQLFKQSGTMGNVKQLKAKTVNVKALPESSHSLKPGVVTLMQSGVNPVSSAAKPGTIMMTRVEPGKQTIAPVSSLQTGISKSGSVVLTEIQSAVKPVLYQASATKPVVTTNTQLTSAPVTLPILMGSGTLKPDPKPNIVLKVSGDSILLSPGVKNPATAAGQQRTFVFGGDKPIPGQSLLNDKAVTLRKIPGTNTYTVEAINRIPGLSSASSLASKQILLGTGSSVSGAKIPVGKVLPLQQQPTSKSSPVQKTSTATSVSQLDLTSLFKTTPSVTSSPMLSIPASTVSQLNVNLKETTATKTNVSASAQVVQSGNESPHLEPMDIVGQSKNHDAISTASNQASIESSLIPMMITAVSDTGNDVSVSRDNIDNSRIDDVSGKPSGKSPDENSGNDNDSAMSRDTDDRGNDVGGSGLFDAGESRSDDKSVSCDTENAGSDTVMRSGDTETSGLDNTTTIDKSMSEKVSGNIDKQQENKSVGDENSNTLSDADGLIGIPALQNVYARVYLAPPSPSESSQDETTAEQKDAESTSLKIDSVFSLNDIQKKAFFPEANNNNAPSETSVDREENDEASFQVHIKREPLDDDDEDDGSQNEETNVSDVRIKEEPQSPHQIQVKDEPSDDYEYSNYPVPNDDDDDVDSEDEDSESTDTAMEETPVKIKKEPNDDELDAKGKTDSKAQGASTTPPLSSTPVVKQPVTPISAPTSSSSPVSILTMPTAKASDKKLVAPVGVNSVVTDINGKKYIVVSPPAKATLKFKGQNEVKGEKGGQFPAGSGKSYLVTMSNGQKRLIHLPTDAPASTLLASLAKGNTVDMKTIAGLKSLTGGPMTKTLPKKEQGSHINHGGSLPKLTTVITYPPRTEVKPPCKITVVKGHKPSSFKKMPALAPSVSKASMSTKTAESKLIDDDSRRRSSRERRNKRRYSPPPLGPRKRQYCVSPPVLEKEAKPISRAAESSDTEHSSEDESRHDDRDGAAEKMDHEPAPLTPAVTSREERMRLLKDLIREKEAALEEMRKRREKEKAEWENDPDLM
ncbi:uncharacterized protein [Amphiura filiformis]|uniref:uncharacterized protein n=1 Tax=Amphiura filiformis TaxID=82378 RepID=UPI003B21475E